MRKIITLLIGIFYFSIQLFSQDLGYDNNSKWFWELNAGGTWHTTDVQNKSGFGLGLTVGRSFNYNYGKKVSFDVRGRLLYGEWRGIDRKRTDFFASDDVLSMGETNYKDSLGYVFRNFSDEVGRMSLEFVMHFNSVRERTKIDPYIFAGIGYSWYRAKGDYLNTEPKYNQTEGMYDYASWEEKLTNKEYLALRDKKNDTYLNGSTSGKKNVRLMPSVGFGIGQQVSPRVYLGLEHKTTFTGIDDFDGIVNQTSFIKNDWYHYSSIYLRFYVKAGRKHRTDVNAHSNNYNQPENDMQPPTVQFTNPSRAGITSEVANYPVRADVKNVFNRENVTFTHNGNNVANFSYNPSSRKFESNVSLIEGENTFEISGSNVYGTDRKTTVVIYKKPDPVPPIVSFQNPSTTPITVTSDVFNVDATILNVDQKSQVRLEVNGNQQHFFTFNTSTKKLSQAINLNVGINAVQIVGTNEVGVDSKTVAIIYNPNHVNPNVNRQPPVVYFVNPSRSPFTSHSNSITLDAKVLHVSNKQNVTFKQNGQTNSSFSYNPSTQDFRSNVTLNSGQNVFEIIGTNPDGSAQATTLVIYERASKNPPIVTITNPTINPFASSQENLNFTATVLNVTSKNQVEVKINGQATTNFTFNNSTVSSNIRLANGATLIEVKGTNQDGSDQKSTVVNYRKPIAYTPKPPVVTITNPTINPFASSQENLNFTATVLNVTSKNQVEVKINGQATTNFTFNNSTVSSNIRLANGATLIEVKGTNQDGSDQKSTVVNYRKPIAVAPKPIITFTNPARCPASMNEGYQEIKGNVVNVKSVDEVVFEIGGKAVTNAQTEMLDGKLLFTIPITISVRLGDISVRVVASNAGGNTNKTCVIKPLKTTVKPTLKPNEVNPEIVVPQESGEPVIKTPSRKPTIRVPAPAGGNTRNPKP